MKIDKFGFHEKVIFIFLFCLTLISIMAFFGGYIKLDLTVFRKIFKGNVNQLEFLGEFRARQVENGYNRIPLFIVEGTIRNSFYETDNVEKVQLKAFAFDHEQNLVDSHFTYTGLVLSDEQLETISPMKIRALRQTGDLSVIDNLDRNEFQTDIKVEKDTHKKDLPFQVIFFKDVSTIKSTSIEIVSYLLNKNLVFLGALNRD